MIRNALIETNDGLSNKQRLVLKGFDFEVYGVKFIRERINMVLASKTIVLV